MRAADLAPVGTHLHADPVVLVVPEALNTLVVGVGGGVGLSCQGFNEEVLRHLSK